jgi:hypothetical protein
LTVDVGVDVDASGRLEEEEEEEAVVIISFA